MLHDWMLGLLGGLMIGGAGALFLLMNGRVMGASGIIGGLVDGSGAARWRESLAFVAGLVLIPAALVLVWGPVDTHLTDNLPLIAVAGVLVGVGTRIANGCTSGHGVCGISRLSLRGIVATVAYIAAGGVAVVIARHLMGVI